MESSSQFVSRGGLKLAAALDAFQLDVAGFACADLGCNVGGFTDCLLQRGASHVFAVDTGYGALAWKLRQDARVTVLERTNALHFDPAQLLAGQGGEGVDLAVIDLGWTRQEHAIPAALRWRPRLIVSLIKPHYEATGAGQAASRKRGGRSLVLDPAQAQSVTDRVLAAMPDLGVEVVDHIPSPILGGKGKGRQGNIEHLAFLRPITSDKNA